MPIQRGKKTWQRRETRRDGMTKAKRATFLRVLLDTCNVRASCRAAGVSHAGVYALKARDGEFAMLWQQAFEHGLERLEEDMIAHGRGHLRSGDNPDAIEIDEGTGEVRAAPFDPEAAMRVLKLRGGLGGGFAARSKGPRTTATVAEIDAALIERLEAVAKRLPRP